MQYSPKLKNAMREIKEILDKYDIAGFCVLHTEGGNGQGFGEYVLKIDPSYSVAKFERPDFIRFRAKLADFNGNKNLWKHKVTSTSNMLNMLSIQGGEISLNMMKLSEGLDRVVGAEHSKGSHTSQQELDN